MTHQPALRSAAFVAYTFHLDPVDVLAEPSILRRAVRLAAHHVVGAAVDKQANS